MNKAIWQKRLILVQSFIVAIVFLNFYGFYLYFDSTFINPLFYIYLAPIIFLIVKAIHFYETTFIFDYKRETFTMIFMLILHCLFFIIILKEIGTSIVP